MAQHIPGTGGSSLEGLRASGSGLASDMARLRMQAQERGEKLGELEDRTQRMQESAMKFSSDAHAVSFYTTFICNYVLIHQVVLARKQRSGLCGLRVELPLSNLSITRDEGFTLSLLLSSY